MRPRSITWISLCLSTLACGSSVDLRRITNAWSNDETVVMLIDDGSGQGLKVRRVMAPGEVFSEQLDAYSTLRVLAVAFPEPTGSSVASCGATLEGGQGTVIDTRGATAFAASIDAHEGGFVGQFERLDDLPVSLRYDRCRPSTLEGTWTGVTHVGHFTIPTRLALRAETRSGFTSGEVEMRAYAYEAILSREKVACLRGFTVTATRTGSAFSGTFDGVSCPGPDCFQGVLTGNVDELAIHGAFRVTRGLCTDLAGEMTLAR